MRPISSWGRLNADPHHVVPLNDPAKIQTLISESGHLGLAHGMGRSYGDVCLNPEGVLWMTKGLDHFMHFDDETGLLRCETGVLLRDIQRMAVPRGWMLPVTPGTQMVTVGGAIANDVHGKNHHKQGSFGDHVQHIMLLRTNGDVIACGPTLQPDWFAATVGGLGLTGVMTWVDIQLCRVPGPWLCAETVPFSTLDEFFQLADNAESDWEHSVSWIDCTSRKRVRGLFMRANPIRIDQTYQFKKNVLTMPMMPPFSLVNKVTLRPINFAYYTLKKWQAARKITHYEPFFYPLDTVDEWHKLYGPKGFFQYQSVVPRPVGKAATRAMLKEIAGSRAGSFLAVLKTFGDRHSKGMLGFPKPGVTLSLDFPNQGQCTHQLFERLDAIVAEAGGCIYLAKDARMSRKVFEESYPRFNEFLTFRDPGISSAMSRRLMGR